MNNSLDELPSLHDGTVLTGGSVHLFPLWTEEGRVVPWTDGNFIKKWVEKTWKW